MPLRLGGRLFCSSMGVALPEVLFSLDPSSERCSTVSETETFCVFPLTF